MWPDWTIPHFTWHSRSLLCMRLTPVVPCISSVQLGKTVRELLKLVDLATKSTNHINNYIWQKRFPGEVNGQRSGSQILNSSVQGTFVFVHVELITSSIYGSLPAYSFTLSTRIHSGNASLMLTSHAPCHSFTPWRRKIGRLSSLLINGKKICNLSVHKTIFSLFSHSYALLRDTFSGSLVIT